VTDLLVNAIDSAVIRPMRLAFGSGKMAIRQIKQNWWKILGGVMATCLLLRLLSRPKMIPIGQVGLNTETADQLASRLSQLERAFASLSDNPRLPADHAINPSSRELTDRISKLEASLSDERNHEQRSLDSIQRDLGKVVSRVDNHDKTLASSQSQLRTVDRIGTDLRALKTRVDAVEVEVRNALDDGRLHKAIERILPEWMPIKRSKGGRIDVEPVFWNEMKKVLVGKGDLDKAVQDALAGRVAGGLNEQDLERFGERLFEQKAAKGLVISRDQFLQAIHNELEDLKARIDRAPPPAKSSPVTIKTQKGDDITSLLQDLIDAAILKYSKDTLATPDYALFTAGARVVPSITSDTLVLKSASTVGKWLAGSRDIEGRSPATALHPDNAVGSCWPFQGSQGQLGILLSRRVVITDVTIEHAAKELSPDTRTAPKTIEVVSGFQGGQIRC
jgi:SUN domain-containing protein 1/2